MNPIGWLIDRILEFDQTLWFVTVKDHPELSIRQWLAIWIRWAIDKGFVHFQYDEVGKPISAVVERPVNALILDKIQNDYAASVWDFDPDGDITFFDFRYGKGTIPLCWDIAKAGGKREVAWYYRQRLCRHQMEDIPRIKGWQKDG